MAENTESPKVEAPSTTPTRTLSTPTAWLDPADWDAVVAESPGATYFHGRLWNETLATRDGRFEPRCLGIRGERGDLLALPMMVRKGLLRRGPLGRAVSTQPGVYGGPVAPGRLLTAGDWERTLAALRGLSVGRFDCYDNVLDPVPAECLAGLRTQERETHALELAGLPEDPRASYRKGCKHSITKARRAELECRPATAAELVDYDAAYRESLARWGKGEGEGYSREFLARLIDQEGAELWAAFAPDGRIAAGGIFLFTPAHCVWWHGAMREEFNKVGASNLLIDGLIRVARDRGARLFDFNPSAGLDGVASFKRSFRAEPHALHAWRHESGLVSRFGSQRF